MLTLVDELNQLSKKRDTISELKRSRFIERNQLSPKERLARLIDPGMPWLEIGNLAGYLMDTDDPAKSIPGGSVIAGIGYISGIKSIVLIDDSGIKAGAMTTGGGWRTRRCQTLSLKMKLPFVHLVESAGADLMNYTVQGFVEGGKLFANLARLSAAGIPTITILHGASTAGGAYMPGLSDYVVAIKGRGKAFLAGKALLKAATGEDADDEELGGAKMHATVTGLTEYLAESDNDGILITRELMSKLKWNRCIESSQVSAQRNAAIVAPKYSIDELAGVVPIDYRKPYDIRESIARIVDSSDFLEFKPDYGVSTLCLQAKILGYECGILSNNGPIDPNGATKAAQFIQLQDQAQTPLVFIQNTTGYLVGTQYEQSGMIKHGSKMIQAVTNARVSRFTIMAGASFGAGNYGMCGQGYDPDFVFSWPNAKTGVMGGEQASKTMRVVAETAAQRTGRSLDNAVMEQQSKILVDHFSKQESAFVTSGLCLDDGVIDPRETRKLLGFLLATSNEASIRKLQPNSFGVARM